MRFRLLCPLGTLTLLGACHDAPPTGLAPRDAPAAAKAAPAAAPSRAVVMTGLDAPRGLAFSPDGSLYVTEAGNTTVQAPCTPVPLPRGTYCYSGTGAVSRLRKGVQERVASGLPSYYNASIPDISGPQHIDFHGQGNGYVTIGWGGPPSGRAELGAKGSAFASLAVVRPNGGWSIEADLGTFEQTQDPDHEGPDSNPFGLLAEPGRQYVTDAGGNSLLKIEHGVTTLVATFPRVPAPAPFQSAQAVPTEVVRGPDGALYVSTLTGVPFADKAAIIYRVVEGSAPVPYVTGLKTVTDLAFAPDGRLYALHYASGLLFFMGPGSIVRVSPNAAPVTVADRLPSATALAIGDDGAFYVAINGDRAGSGQVLRIVP